VFASRSASASNAEGTASNGVDAAEPPPNARVAA
jgi:hypothetical protein